MITAVRIVHFRLTFWGANSPTPLKILTELNFRKTAIAFQSYVNCHTLKSPVISCFNQGIDFVEFIFHLLSDTEKNLMFPVLIRAWILWSSFSVFRLIKKIQNVTVSCFDQGMQKKHDQYTFHTLEIHVAGRDAAADSNNNAAPRYRLFSHQGILQDALVSMCLL